MRVLWGMLGDPRCLRVGAAWWFPVLAAIVFSVAESHLHGTDALIGALLVAIWWAGIAATVTLIGMAVRRVRLPWHPVASVVVVSAAIAAGWLALFAAAAAARAHAQAEAIWQASISWIPTSLLTLLLVVAGGHYLHLAVAQRQSLENSIATLKQRTGLLDEATQQVLDEVAAVKRDVASALATPAPEAAAGEPIRHEARAASHRIAEITPGAPHARRSAGAWLALWMDDISFAPRWQVLSGYALVLAIIAPRAVLVSGIESVIDIGWFVIAGIVAAITAAVVHPRVLRMATIPRRLALPLCISVPLIVPTALLFDSRTSGIQLVISTAVTVPLIALGAFAPTTVAVDVHRRDVQFRDLQSRLAVAQCEQDVAEERLQEAREAALSELHGRVQGRALALITSAELRDAGFVDADPLTERALFGLAEWAASAEMTAASSEHDPLAVATEAWTGVLDVRLTVDDTLSWQDRMRVAPFLQDALVNAVGHGRAQAAHVSVTAEAGELLLTVVDDGTGPAGGPAGLGLRRVESAGGDWHLHADTSGGTRLDVRLPGAQGKPGRRDSGTPPTTTAL